MNRFVIRKILGLGFGNEKYRNQVKREQQLKVIYGRDANVSVQPNANILSLGQRLIHHFVCTILIPKVEKYEYIYDKELFFL